MVRFSCLRDVGGHTDSLYFVCKVATPQNSSKMSRIGKGKMYENSSINIYEFLQNKIILKVFRKLILFE